MHMHTGARQSILVSLIVGVAVVSGCARNASSAPAYPRVYEYTYEYNTPTLIENHYIVLDSAGGSIRGWYFGTTDDFDAAREGYLPGFFVTDMEDLRVSSDSIAFTLRPRELFGSPVPLRYRDSGEIPRDSLPRWTGPTLEPVKGYSGTITADRISLETARNDRVFLRLETRL
jgi:hypothetical protein